MAASHRYSPLSETFARKEEWNGNSKSRSTTLQSDNVTTIRGGRSPLKASVGQLDLAAFASASKSPGTFAELEEVINRNMGKTRSDVVLGI